MFIEIQTSTCDQEWRSCCHTWHGNVFVWCHCPYGNRSLEMKSIATAIEGILKVKFCLVIFDKKISSSESNYWQSWYALIWLFFCCNQRGQSPLIWHIFFDNFLSLHLVLPTSITVQQFASKEKITMLAWVQKPQNHVGFSSWHA